MWSRFKRIFQKGGEDVASTAPETIQPVSSDPEQGLFPEMAASPGPETPEIPPEHTPPVVEPTEPTEIFAAATELTPAAMPVEPAGTFHAVAEPFPEPEPVESAPAFDTDTEPTPAAVPVEATDTFEAATGPTSGAVPKLEENEPLAMDPISDEPLSHTNELTLETTDAAVSSEETLHADPITGEPGAHPASVGVGALGAGAAGAAIGALAGPVGIVIGAAIGAVAGGLAGHEVAVSNDEQAAEATGVLDPEATGSTTDETGRPSSVTGSVAEGPEHPLEIFPGSDLGSPMIMATSFAAEAVEPGSGPGHASVLTPTEETHGSEFTSDGSTEETVRRAAYYLYLDRLEAGRPTDALADWYDAEREVKRF